MGSAIRRGQRRTALIIHCPGAGIQAGGAASKGFSMITLRYPPTSFVVGLWLGERPDAAYPADVVVERALPAPTRPQRPEAQAAAAEHSKITGGRAYYGLLGATFTPDGSERLRLTVAATSGYGGRRYTGPSVRPRVRGQVGLPREHVDAVIAGALLALETDPLGGGDLRFDRAIHHMVDSNDFTYQRLAMLVTRLLQPDATSMTEDELARLAEAYLRR